MTGAALDTYEYIPRAVVECVAKQLNVPAPMLATTRALSRRPMTRHRHQSWACRYLGISRLKAADEQALLCALTADMSVTVDRERLITRTHEIFWNHRWRIPTRRAVEQKVREAMRRVEAMDMEALRRVLRPEEMERTLSTVDFLLGAGWDVIHASQCGLATASDEAILQFALANDRVICTLDTSCWLKGRARDRC
jgi:hypothetical protein